MPSPIDSVRESTMCTRMRLSKSWVIMRTMLNVPLRPEEMEMWITSVTPSCASDSYSALTSSGRGRLVLGSSWVRSS